MAAIPRCLNKHGFDSWASYTTRYWQAGEGRFNPPIRRRNEIIRRLAGWPIGEQIRQVRFVNRNSDDCAIRKIGKTFPVTPEGPEPLDPELVAEGPVERRRFNDLIRQIYKLFQKKLDSQVPFPLEAAKRLVITSQAVSTPRAAKAFRS